MKKSIIILALAVLCTGCYTRLGGLTMASTRNVEATENYTELQRYVIGKGNDIEGAIENTVKHIPRGEFVKNITIEQNWFTGKFRVTADVWGK